MYFEMLANGDTEFAEAVRRGALRWKTRRLDNVVLAVQAAQLAPNAANLNALLNSMHVWRTREPDEFANRGGTRGVAYRLWMEAKQALHNNHGQVFPQPDPLMPPLCPGVVLNGIYVPEGEGHAEICHGFAYRWAVAAGKMPLNPALPARKNYGVFNPANSTPVLYPAGYAAYLPARVNGVMQTQPGAIVGMFLVVPPQLPELKHSLIAETASAWYSANNVGSFGVGTGRSRIDTAGAFPLYGEHQVGWVEGGARWRRPDGVVLEVIHW